MEETDLKCKGREMDDGWRRGSGGESDGAAGEEMTRVGGSVGCSSPN